MFIELIDTNGKHRYINPNFVQEVCLYGKNEITDIWKVIFHDSCSYFSSYNIDKLIGHPIKKSK